MGKFIDIRVDGIPVKYYSVDGLPPSKPILQKIREDLQKRHYIKKSKSKNASSN